MKIIVLNLPKNIKEDDFSEMFKRYGKVESSSLVMDNKTKNLSKGFGFIEMNDESEANEAIKELHGKRVGGNKIRVKLADESGS